jgi:hypothetical protein
MVLLQKTCSNWDMSRPGPRPFPCPAGHVFLGANEFYSPPSKEVCCSVSGWLMLCCIMVVHLSQHAVHVQYCCQPLHSLKLEVMYRAQLYCQVALLPTAWQLPPKPVSPACCRVRRPCQAPVLMPTVSSLGRSLTLAPLEVCWTQAARPSRTYQTTCAAW